MSLPGRPPRGRGPEPTSPAMAAGRGAVLVGLAVIVGLLILATIDNGGPATSTPAANDTPVVDPTTPATNADGTPADDGGDDGNNNTKGARANDQVVVQVLNGSGVQGAATQRSNDLRAKGYSVVGANNAPETRQGTVVECKDGYEKEAQVLVDELGALGTPATIEPVPDPLPAGFDPSANCYVVLGA